MAERIYDQDPELAAEAEALRRQHARPNGAGAVVRFTAEQWTEIQRLLDLNPIERDNQIEPAAKNLGCLVGTLRKILTGFLREKNGDHGDPETAGKSAAGQALKLPEIVPWPGAVDGASVLDEIVTTIRRFVVVRESVADAVALWVVHTHALDAAFISARLAITSPVRRCGKTTLLDLLGALVPRSLSTMSIKAAGVFRTVDMLHPTLLIDEADTFLVGDDELRGIINAGHRRSTSRVVRAVELPQGYDVRGFDVWCALAIAAIGKLPATIDDRSIKVALQRRRRDEVIDQLRLDRLEEFGPLASRGARWALDYLPRLRVADPLVPSELHDRAADNWRPLLAIADRAGGDWPRRGREAAVALSNAGFDDAESRREMLLADLRAMFDDGKEVLFTEEILTGLNAMDQRPWSEYRAGKPITSHQLAALLRPLHVRPNSVRRGERTGKGYEHKDLGDAFARYLAPPPT
jgi:putative DNA primase/helicase